MSDTTLTPVVGTPLSRVEGRAKVTGQAQYAYEQPVEGVAYAAASRRPSPAARSRAVDAARGARDPRRARRHLARERAAAGRGRRRRAEALPVARGRLPRPDRRRGGRRVAGGRAGGGRRRRDRLRRRPRTTSSCAPATRASTSPRRSTRPSRPTSPHGDLDAGAGGRGGRGRRDLHDASRSTTTRWSRTRASPCWDGGGPHALRLDPGHVAARADASPRCSALEPEQVRVISPARRRRLRLQGHAAAARRRSPRSPRRLVERPVKVALDAAAAVLDGRLPHADDPARAPRRRARRPAARDRPRRVEQTSTVREFAEQTDDRHAPHVRGARPADHAPPRRARRADAVVDARARRVPGHVRARVGDGRARGRLRHRPDRAADRATSPPRIPRTGIPFSSRNLVACLREGARALRLGRPRPGARRAPRRPLAGRHRRRRLDLPGLPLAVAGDARGSTPTATSRSRSPPPTSAPARAPSSPRSPPTRSASTPSRCAWRSATATSARPRSPAARWAPRRGARPSSRPAGRCWTRARAR